LSLKIVVTGALGHIGSKLIRDERLKKSSKQLLLFDDLSTQRYNSLFAYPLPAPYSLFEGDLRQSLTPEIASSCDAVVHLAANTKSSSSIFDPSMVSQNLELTRHVASCCLLSKTPIVFVSSTSVYGSHSGVVDEHTTIETPVTPYAMVKRAEEELLLALAQDGLPVTILRLGTIFGVSPGMQFHTAVSKFCWQAATKSEINVWSTAFDQMRPYLHVSDAAGAIVRAIELEGKGPRIANIVGCNSTVREILKSIEKHVGELPIAIENHPAMRENSFTVEPRVTPGFGYEASMTLDEGISETMRLLLH